MGFFSKLADAFTNARTNRARNREWEERFTNEPEQPNRNLPLDDNPNTHHPR